MSIIFKQLLVLSVVLCLINSLEWYDKDVLYQIYPKSFVDSNSTGIGDLKGITSKAKYFKDIGIKAVWLSPIFASPFKDNGYDISDYMKIADIFGTLDDLKELIKQFHENGIKVLLDLVPNHTSEEHQWFKDSIEKKNDKDDYYVWKDPNFFDPDGKPVEPNNWLSIFGGKAWTFNDKRNQFYLHQFGSYQPDLNYNNPKVIEEMKGVLRYWLDLGVDGFRVDAVPYLVEDKDFTSEIQISNCNNKDSYDCYYHNMTKDLQKTYDVLKELEKVLTEEKYKDTKRVFLLEAYSTIEKTMKYYSNHSIPFDFNLLTSLQRDSNASQVESAITSWMKALPEGKNSIWVIGNHDNSRVGSRMGEEMIDAMNMLVFLAPGNTVTYYGEEIGMIDTYLKSNEMFDQRNPERTPMQWNNKMNAGFSNASQLWLPINPNYWKINVEKEKSDKKSHLSIYKSLINVQNDIIESKNYSTYVLSPWVFSLYRSNHLLIINLDDNDQNVNISTIKEVPSTLYARVTSLNSNSKEGDTISKDKLLLMRPRSAVLLRTNSSGVIHTISMFLLIGLLMIYV